MKLHLDVWVVFSFCMSSLNSDEGNRYSHPCIDPKEKQKMVKLNSSKDGHSSEDWNHFLYQTMDEKIRQSNKIKTIWSINVATSSVEGLTFVKITSLKFILVLEDMSSSLSLFYIYIFIYLLVSIFILILTN